MSCMQPSREMLAGITGYQSRSSGAVIYNTHDAAVVLCDWFDSPRVPLPNLSPSTLVFIHSPRAGIYNGKKNPRDKFQPCVDAEPYPFPSLADRSIGRLIDPWDPIENNQQNNTHTQKNKNKHTPQLFERVKKEKKKEKKPPPLPPQCCFRLLLASRVGRQAD